MPRLVKPKHKIHAVRVSTETLEIVADWCNGSIKGIKLPRSNREIEFWSAGRQSEMRAANGDYIVKLGPNTFEVFPSGMFHAIFKDIDPITF